MFISFGSAVDIISGPCAGQRGIIRDLRICDERHHVMVFVDVLDLVAGRADLRIYDPENLKLRKRDDREMAALMDLIVGQRQADRLIPDYRSEFGINVNVRLTVHAGN